MKIKVVVLEAEEGGYWAEVPAIPGCATQGETMEDPMANVHEPLRPVWISDRIKSCESPMDLRR
jgi:predicted RNase H-like HicB family nuclease